MFKKVIGFIMTSLLMTQAFANPLLHVSMGKAVIQQTNSSIEVQQTSPLLILTAPDFDIAANEQINFQQPDHGIVLIRVHSGKEASKIFGHLSATGRVMLINHAGIIFEKSAEVHIGGIIATTSDILNKNFLAQKFIFDQSSPYPAKIVNHGIIQAANNGLVALLGTAVENS